jgi:hypothetical protein
MPPKGRGGRGAGARRGTRKKATPAAKQPSDTSSLSSQEEEEEEQQPVRHKITLKGPTKKTSSQGSSTTTSGKAGKGSKAKEKGKKGKGKAVVQPPLQVHSEDESVAAEEESDGGTASQPAEKKRKFHAPLTDDEEEQMIDWLRDHPELYNRKLKSYKDIRAKEAHWMDIAAILGRDVHYLKTWYQSIRTRFGRLRKKKSGDGAADHTDRDAWILRCLDFLAPHIVEVRSRAAVSVSKHYFIIKAEYFSRFYIIITKTTSNSQHSSSSSSSIVKLLY